MVKLTSTLQPETLLFIKDRNSTQEWCKVARVCSPTVGSLKWLMPTCWHGARPLWSKLNTCWWLCALTFSYCFRMFRPNQGDVLVSQGVICCQEVTYFASNLDVKLINFQNIQKSLGRLQFKCFFCVYTEMLSFLETKLSQQTQQYKFENP